MVLSRFRGHRFRQHCADAAAVRSPPNSDSPSVECRRSSLYQRASLTSLVLSVAKKLSTTALSQQSPPPDSY